MQDYLLARQIELIGEKLKAFSVVEVDSVMRRQKEVGPGEIIDIIDYYPPWNAARTFGIEKVAHEYIDHDWQRKRFEKYSGMPVDEIPVYEGTQALRRNPVQDHPKNVQTKKPFRMLVIPNPPEPGQTLSTENITRIDKFLVAVHSQIAQREREGLAPDPQNQPQAAKTAVSPQSYMPPEPETAQNGNLESPEDVSEKAIWWKKQALDCKTTEGVYGLDYAIGKALGKDEKIIRTIREKVFGNEYDPRFNSALVEGLVVYAAVRQSTNDHVAAMESALNAYNNIASKLK